jgi:hypothetical protein
MADIFISHSGNDNDVAAAIGERILRERPTWSLFYDKDNIRAGQYWQERLREELTSCRVVLALLSRNWLGSPWCFTEAVTAAFRGKDVVGIETEDLTSDDLARAADPARTPARSFAERRQPGLEGDSGSARPFGARPQRLVPDPAKCRPLSRPRRLRREGCRRVLRS